MSRKKIDLDIKIVELRSLLIKYKGLPSQKVDRIAYARIKYFVKNYGEDERIKNLIREFDIVIGSNIKYSKYNYKQRLEEIEEYLKTKGKVPSIKDDATHYNAIRYFFQKYSDGEEVIRLKYIYTYGDIYPLDESKAKRPEYNPYSVCLGDGLDYSIWKNNSACEYIYFVYSRFGELPGRNTKPMEELRYLLTRWTRFQNSQKNKSVIKNLISYLFDNGCRDALIVKAKYSMMFETGVIQKRVNDLLRQHGACTIGYIANQAIPGIEIDINFVYYYYYNLLNDDCKYRGISPLGELFYGVNELCILYIHYRELTNCDIDSIRERVICQNRDWDENPPETVKEMEEYGEYRFFIPANNSDWCRDEYLDFSKPFPQNCIEKGHPYFRYYKYNSDLKYLDYKLYLLEHNCDLLSLKNSFELDKLQLSQLCDHKLQMLEVDAITAYNIAKYSPECIVDENGGIYKITEEGLVLLFFAPNAVYFKVRRLTVRFSLNALLTCYKTIQEISFGPNIKSICQNSNITKCLDDCPNLSCIIIPPFKLNEYRDIFSEKCIALFCDNNHRPL